MTGISSAVFFCMSVITCVIAQGYSPKYPDFTQPANKLNNLRRSLGDSEAVYEFAESFLGVLQSIKKGDGATLERLNHAAPPKAYNVSATCVKHAMQIFTALYEKQTWAIYVLDSMGKLPSGVAEGDLLWPGGFDQCRSVIANVYANSSTHASHPFKGQYCMATIGNSTAINPLIPGGMPTNIASLNLGVCVPDSCSEEDTRALINTVLYPLPNEIEAVYVRCVGESVPLDGTAVGVIVLLSIIGVLLVCGTFYDVAIHRPKLLREQEMKRLAMEVGGDTEEHRESAEHSPLLGSPGNNDITTSGRSNHADTQSLWERITAKKLLLAMSMYSNGEKILDPSTSAQSNLTCVHGIRFLSMTWVILGHCYVFGIAEISVLVNLLLCFSCLINGGKLLTVLPALTTNADLRAVHGIRFLSMTWVILGHSYAFAAGLPRNLLQLLTMAKTYWFQAILNATVSVDSFFLLSGTLASYLLLRELKEKNGPRGVNWALVYFHRFWRLTPPYMLVLAIYTALLRYFGEGPLYPQAIDANCQANWWQNLLYINNFFGMTNMCISWSWYLANDMQFFVITPLLLIPLYLWKAVGLVLILGAILMNVIWTAVVTKQNNYVPDMPGMLADPTAAAHMAAYEDSVYILPWHRVGVYMVGLLLGYVLYVTDKRVRMHKAVVVVGWLVAFAINWSVLYGLYNVANGHPLSPGVNAFYAGTHRVAWAVGLAWVVFACVTGHGGFVNTLLSWPPLIPLSRLTYMAYLVHPTVMIWYFYGQRSLIFISHTNIVMLFFGFLVMSYGLGFILSLAFEAPMMALEKVVFPRR